MLQINKGIRRLLIAIILLLIVLIAITFYTIYSDWIFNSETEVSPKQSVPSSNSFNLPQDANLLVHLKQLDQAQTPFTSHGYLFFTYKESLKTRAVGIAFDFEQFTKINMMQKNSQGLFLYALPIPQINRVGYRLWIDGTWIKDPTHSQVYFDNYETPISYYQNDKPYRSSLNPIQNPDGYAFFVYFEPKLSIHILGNFNNWNPFINLATEVEPGKYYISLGHLEPGEYQYFFLVGGSKHLDPRNHKTAIDENGQKVSTFRVTKSEGDIDSL